MELRLTTPELLVALRTLGITGYPALDTPELAKQPPDEIAGMLAAARGSLIARELAATDPANPRTGLALEQEFTGLIAIAAAPEASFIINLRDANGFRAITVHWTRDATCRTWRDSDDVHTFVIREPQDAAAVAAEITQAIGALGASAPANGAPLAVPEAVISGLAGLASGGAEARASNLIALEAAGLSALDAVAIADAFSKPDRSGGVIAASNGKGGAADALFWSIRGNSAWLVKQTGGEAMATLQPLSEAALSVALRAAVDRALQTSQPMEAYLDSLGQVLP